MQSSDPPQSYVARSVQVAEYLEHQILSGIWTGRLPSERNLVNYAGVGRDTIRAAFKVLEQRGWKFQRSQAGTYATPPHKMSVSADTTVGLLLPMGTDQTTHRTLLWIDELRKFLYNKNIRMLVYDRYYRTPRLMESLVDTIFHHCWVIAYPNVAAQQWCVRTGIRGVVVGRVSNDIPLPSVDIHYRAVHRHAVARMVQAGHRNLVLILHRRHWESDIESQLGFFDGVESSTEKNIQARVEFHDGTSKGICKLVDRLLSTSPTPTGWIINVAPHFLTAMMHLLARGVQIPKDISMISPDAEPWQNFVSPEPARYVADVQTLAKRTGQLVQNIINGSTLTNDKQYVMPVFKSGSTLNSPANSRFI